MDDNDGEEQALVSDVLCIRGGDREYRGVRAWGCAWHLVCEGVEGQAVVEARSHDLEERVAHLLGRDDMTEGSGG